MGVLKNKQTNKKKLKENPKYSFIMELNRRGKNH